MTTPSTGHKYPDPWGAQLWADPDTCSRLQTAGHFARDSHHIRQPLSFVVELPDLQPGDLVLPSFSALSQEPWQFQCALNNVLLPPVPSKPTTDKVSSSVRGNTISTHLDWFEVHTALTAPTLTVTTTAPAMAAPHLLGISIRPLHQATPRISIREQHHASAPPTISQQQAGADIRGRICSPTAVTMVLKQQGLQPDWLSFVDLCRDPASGMYGLWPLCILRAAQAGALGVVRTFTGWQDVTPLLAANLPVVASIRYAKDALPGAPMAATSGHLVVVYGVDDEWVLVNDPAAPEHASVPRRYPREAFERAWFDHRGAGYVLLGPASL